LAPKRWLGSDNDCDGVNSGNGSLFGILGNITNRGTIVLTNGGIPAFNMSATEAEHGLLVNAAGG